MIRAMLLALLLITTGCQILLPVESQPSKIISVDRERLPAGNPTITIRENSDHSEWTITARQDYRRRIESITTRPDSVRRYRWWPLAPLSGLLQCPIGLLSAPFTDKSGILAMRQVGCMRLIGMEPLQNTANRTNYDERIPEVLTEVGPAPGLAVVFIPDNHPEETVRLITDVHGKVVLSRSILQTTHDQVVAGNLEVRNGNKTLFSEHIAIAPSPRSKVTGRLKLKLDKNEPLIVQVQPFSSHSGTVVPTIHTNLIKALTQAGIPVIADLNDYQLLVEEIWLQHQRASDVNSVRLGRLITPTVRIEGVEEDTEGVTRVTSKIYSVRTGEYVTIVMYGSPRTVAMQILSVLTTKH